MSQSRSLRRKLSRAAASTALVAAAVGTATATAAGNAAASAQEATPGAVFVQTNASAGNDVLSYQRSADGQLVRAGAYSTGGRGTGRPHLSSENSVVLSADRRFLLVADVGSNQVSVFRVRGAELQLVDLRASGGEAPNSIAMNGDLVYVLNNGGTRVGNVTGFRLGQDGHLAAMSAAGSALSVAGSDPAQVGITPDARHLIVTEKATNIIDTWALGADGRLGERQSTGSAGVTPFGFDFTRNGTFVVTNAEQGRIGDASASSYALDANGVPRTISGSVRDGRSEVCWTVISKDQKHAYITNFGDGTISSYTINTDGTLSLLQSIAATTTFGQKSIRDAGLSADGRYLYAIDITSRKVHAWSVMKDGALRPIGAFAGLPGSVAGLASA